MLGGGDGRAAFKVKQAVIGFVLEGAAGQEGFGGLGPLVLVDAEDAFTRDGDGLQFTVGAVAVADNGAVRPGELGFSAGLGVLVAVAEAVIQSGGAGVGDGFGGLAVGSVIGYRAAGGLLALGAGGVGVAPGGEVVGIVPGIGDGADWLGVAGCGVVLDFGEPVGLVVSVGGLV